MTALIEPWWVWLFLLVPPLTYRLGRAGFRTSLGQALGLTAWAIGCGAVEGIVVIYLRAIGAAVAGSAPHVADVARLSADPRFLLTAIPSDLVVVEVWREAATIVMLTGAAAALGRSWRERIAAFLWTFAWWDLTYYATLWLFVRWPGSVATLDVLFLIPTSWIAPVWFPIAVSLGTTLAIAARWRRA